MSDSKNQIDNAMAELDIVLDSMKNAKGNLAERLDVAESIIANLVQSVITQANSISDVNKTNLSLIDGMKNLIERVAQLEANAVMGRKPFDFSGAN